MAYQDGFMISAAVLAAALAHLAASRAQKKRAHATTRPTGADATLEAGLARLGEL